MLNMLQGMIEDVVQAREKDIAVRFDCTTVNAETLESLMDEKTFVESRQTSTGGYNLQYSTRNITVHLEEGI